MCLWSRVMSSVSGTGIPWQPWRCGGWISRCRMESGCCLIPRVLRFWGMYPQGLGLDGADCIGLSMMTWTSRRYYSGEGQSHSLCYVWILQSNCETVC